MDSGLPVNRESGEGCYAPFHNAAWAEANPHTKWHPDLSNRLATINTGRDLYSVRTLRKWRGLLCSIPWGSWIPI